MTSLAPELIGSSETFTRFRRDLERAAASEATVLLSGESGTGKGAAARLLHACGPRAEGPYVVCSLAALSLSLCEATLFGHERGAFTDAHRERRGLFRQAEGGTLVLDDVDLLPREVQVKLLRALQERVIEPLGSEQPVPIDARIVATTNKELAQEVEAGSFRQDLFYRLAVVTLEVPPLRARGEDVIVLAEHLARGVAARLAVPLRPFEPAALARLRAHPWPGNVRELENAVERVLVLGPPAQNGSPAPIAAGELDFLDAATDGVAGTLARDALRHGLGVEELTRALMEAALNEERGNVSAAARRVGLTRRAFDYRFSREGEREA